MSEEYYSTDGSLDDHKPQEWQSKNWTERKALKRKWKEEKLIKELEKQKQVEEEETKKAKVSEEQTEERKHLGRQYTTSIALPGSILDNAQTPELRTYLAGQIARAAVVFNVDEIVIFDESGTASKTTSGEFKGVGKRGNCNVQMARILQYLECPQYLRKCFFPQHKDLQYAGLLNPLDCPNHVKITDQSQYREGIVLDKPVKEGKGSYVNVGLMKEVQIDKKLQHGIRVTVEMKPSTGNKKRLRGQVVSPTAPRTDGGLYWGYSVRLASSLGAVLTECPHPAGYDVMVGTSDKGTSLDSCQLKTFSHLLVVFGGLEGLEAALDSDPHLQVDDPSLLFDHYLNTCPGQGSNTIRTEEAILITLAALRPKIQEAQPGNSK